MSNDDGLASLVSLFGAMAFGPSNSGNRKDGKICTAQGGECRQNYKFYSVGMRDAKSWEQPFADDSCPDACRYLRESATDARSNNERYKQVDGILKGFLE